MKKLALYFPPEAAEIIGNALDALHRGTPIQNARPILEVFEALAFQCKNQEAVKAQISADSTPTTQQNDA